jgi:hypothetical protein
MAVPSNTPPLFNFTVIQTTPLGPAAEDCHLVAAYFTEDGVYTLFKDSRHATVEGFRTDTVLRIIRGTAASGRAR